MRQLLAILMAFSVFLASFGQAASEVVATAPTAQSAVAASQSTATLTAVPIVKTNTPTPSSRSRRPIPAPHSSGCQQ